MDEESRLAWDDFRQRTRRYTFTYFGGLVAGAVLMLILLTFDAGALAIGVMFVFLPAWFVLSALAWIHLCAFACPRCGKPFNTRNLPFLRSCPHCGLPRGASKHEPSPLWWHNPGKFEWPEPKETSESDK